MTMQIVTPPGMQNPMSAQGDLIVGAAAGAPQRLALGPVNQALTNTGGVIAWAPVNLDLVWPLAAGVDETFEPSGVNNIALTLHNPANAVNGVKVSGAVTGGSPTVAATGSDANIGLVLSGQGANGVQLTGNGGFALTWSSGSLEDWLQFPSGNTAIGGASTTSDLHINSRGFLKLRGGAGSVNDLASDIVIGHDGSSNSYLIAPNGMMRVIAGGGSGTDTLDIVGHGGAGDANGLSITAALTGVAPSLTAMGTDTNISLNLVTKGSGGLLVNGAPLIGVTWPLANTGDESFQPTSVANNALTLTNQASAVNGVKLTASSTGNNVSVESVGSDIAVPFSIIAKANPSSAGSAAFYFVGRYGGGVGDVTLAKVSAQSGVIGTIESGIGTFDTSMNVGALNVGGSTAGTARGMFLDGTNNLIFNLGNPREGMYLFYNTAGPVAHTTTIIDDGASNLSVGNDLANQLKIGGAATTVAPAITVMGSDTNVGLNLVTKGTGPLYINGSAGSATNVLTSNGASAAPTWSAAPGVTWPLTNSGDETFQPNSVANNVLDLNNPASAVNGVKITGAATGLIPTITAIGSDTNVGLTINAKGTGATNLATVSSGAITIGNGNAGAFAVTALSFQFTGNGGNSAGMALSSAGGVTVSLGAEPASFAVNDPLGPGVLTATTVSNGVNGVTVTAAASGASPTIKASGSDTNIQLNVLGKGTSGVLIGAGASVNYSFSGSAIQAAGGSAALYRNTATGSTLLGGNAPGNNPGQVALTATGVTSGVNGITVTQAATGNGPTLAATGQDTNVNLSLASQGTGGFLVSTNGVNRVNIPGNSGNAALSTPGTSTQGWILANAQSNHLVTTGVLNAVNYLTLTTAATGTAPSLTSSGSDTNIDHTLAGKGTGVVNFGYASVALGGGATATLGTIGGSGPATAGQFGWLPVKWNGTTTWLPGWR